MIDSHCHLDFEPFHSRLDEVLAAARGASVHTVVNIGADIKSSRRSVDLASSHEMIYATVGVHPHDAKTVNEDILTELEQLASHHKVVAIGEIGLDFFRDLSPRPVQKKAFHQQLELAAKLNMPVVIHTREAFRQTVDIVRVYSADLPGGVFHCFPGTVEEAHEVFELGFIVGLGGVITYRGAGMAQVAAEVPLEKIVLETDAPYLTPVPHRGKTNEPAYLKHTCRKLAELRSISVDEVERVTDRACQKLYRLVETFGD
ncbi:MAG: TatD family hydrolase [candidate division Zixibacteria bacterium]|nr:TatD family hydrolase [candidate division Zixibacteria bacterium]MDH3935960.1 TatD family hydrolase [candidate division Zixibacteria bacterium]MDH4035383.1 TatD family hydrolase [candidate division Zixibacteria bacterium]